MPNPPTPESLFAERVAYDPSRPFLTFYDDASGERVELSAKSLGNWVAKTHFLLLDDLGLGVGDRAWLKLPVHWLAAPVALGCWFAGLELTDDAANADVAFATVEDLEAAKPATPEQYAVSLLSMGRSGQPPQGMTDYAAAVRPMPDAWATVWPQATPTDAALDGISRAEAVDRAQAAASDLALASGGRLLWREPWQNLDSLITSLLAPLAVGGSVVLVRNPDERTLAKRIDSENVTAVR